MKAFVWGAIVAIAGGLIGVGGAEFRIPVLVNVFHYRPLPTVIINLMISLVTVTFSLVFRSGVIGLEMVIAHGGIILNLLCGSLLGSYLGVRYATAINEQVLRQIIVIFLIVLSFILLGHNVILGMVGWDIPWGLQVAIGVLAGLVIGLFSSLLGVAGGELLIPTITLVFGVDIRLAGSLSLVISLFTILMGLGKYRSQGAFSRITNQKQFIFYMAFGSALGAGIGSYLLQYVTSDWIYIILGLLLLGSALKLSQHTDP
ncbi:sulfite exporter TauE/SafE family protein [Sodalinema gerasimenkoae]|uniref:sulfite exporter TauE/SafE family protein n=1 Tax=Sodalinema gerasimenkoae TaxID=2862348 RepID=UPI001FEBB218|nr:sulfite exporter TauE/SafE family protein [Sodalinema gerasimenkoae]